MHCIIRIKDEPVILLSQKATIAIYEKILILISNKQINTQGIENFLSCMDHYVYDYPIMFPAYFDIAFEFKDNPKDLQILIDLLIQTVKEMSEEYDDFDEADNVLGFVDDLKQLLTEIKLPESFA